MSWTSILSCIRLIYDLVKAVWRLIKPFHKEWAKEHREAGIAWIDWFWAKGYANIFCLIWPAQVVAARIQSSTFNNMEAERNTLLPEGISTENCFFMERAAEPSRKTLVGIQVATNCKCQDPRNTYLLQDGQDNYMIRRIHHGVKRQVIARWWILSRFLKLTYVRTLGGFAYGTEERSLSKSRFCIFLYPALMQR